LFNSSTGQKGTIQDSKIFPSIAILCPELYVTLPKEWTALTGMDAFAHAFESYFNCSKESKTAEAFSLLALDLILKNLPKLYSDPLNQNLRKEMAQASMYAGLAIAHRGTSVAHAIAETLAGQINISHSLSVSVSTIPVLKASLKDNTFYKKLEELSVKLSIGKSSFLDNLENMYHSLNLNKSLSGFINIDSIDLLPNIVVKNIMEYKFRPLKQYPIKFTESELFEIIKEVLIECPH
jgi:alcohol dehydrogenase/1,3-propanediol dehydrogenase